MRNRTVAGLDLIEIPGDPGGATVVLLHGFGSDASDLIGLSSVYQKGPRPTWIFPNGPMPVPLAPGYVGRAWFPIDIEALQQPGNFEAVANAFPPELGEARTALEQLIIDLEVPRSQLILGGFSQGAVLATETALHGADRVAGLLVLSGTLVCEPEWRRRAPMHAKTPFFQSHGTHDAVLPFAQAEKLAALLSQGGLEGKLHTFTGGHEIPQAVLVQLNAFLNHLLADDGDL